MQQQKAVEQWHTASLELVRIHFETKWPFNVIHARYFWFQSKACIKSNIVPIISLSCTFQRYCRFLQKKQPPQPYFPLNLGMFPLD